MSTTIDERVVEMRFDNKQFESNVATSMSTLEKLKQKLNLSGASKGLEDVNAAAKRVDMSGLGGAVDSIKAKFSAMDVVAVTALANITNSAVNTGKRLVSSLSVDQVKEGWKKFSDKTTSVATLVAQGNAIGDVNKQLVRLNWFTDETSYNFTDMVSNIAKFTATGKGLDESVTAMEGIATWAALSGQNAQTASRAMYQLSQAMGAGVLRLEDYKSIQNASMDTEEFRQKCIDAAIELGTLQEVSEGVYQSLVATGKGAESFNISQFTTKLTDGAWMTSEVMMEVFNNYSAAVNGIYEAAEEKGMLASEVIDEIYETAESGGISVDEAIQKLGYSFDSFALKAFEAAQKARTFGDAIDSVKDAVSTGWMNTFELIFGDAEQATKLWTDVANQLYDVFAAGGERRNEILENTMISKWDTLIERVNDAGIETDKFEQKIAECAESGGIDVDKLTDKYGTLSEAFKQGAIDVKYIKEAVDLFNGAIGETADESEKAAEAVKKISVDLSDIFESNSDKVIPLWSPDAETVRKIQTALTELGFELPVYGIDGLNGPETKKAIEEFQQSVGLTATGIVDEATVNAMMEAGNAIEEIGDAAAKSEIEVDDLIDGIDRMSGQELVFETIHNVLEGIVGILTAFRDAWAEVFSVERASSGLYNFLDALHSLSEKLVLSESSANKLKSTFKGVIAIFDILTSIVGGALKAAFDIICAVFDTFSFDALNITRNIGDAIAAFRDWIAENEVISTFFETVVEGAKSVIGVVKSWITAFTEIPIVKNFLFELNRKFIQFSLSAKNMDLAMKKLKERFEAFKNLEFVQAIFTKIEEAYASFTAYIPVAIKALGEWFEGFKETEGVKQLVNAVKSLYDALVKLFKGEINSSEFATALGENLGKALASLPAIAGQLASDFLAGFTNGLGDGVSGVISKIVEFCSNFISVFASALGIHSPSTITYADGAYFIDGFSNGVKDKVGSVLDILKSICATILEFFKGLWEKAKNVISAIDWKKVFAGAMLVGAIWFLKKIGDFFGSLTGLFKSIGGVFESFSGVLDGFKRVLKSFSKVLNGIAWDFKAKALLKMAAAIAILVACVWALTRVDDIGKLWNAVGVIAVLAVILAALALAMNKISAASMSFDWENGLNIDGLRTAILQIGIAIALIAFAVKMLGNIPESEATAGFIRLGVIVAGMLAFMAVLGEVTKNNSNINGVAPVLIKMAVAIALMAVVCKLVAKLSPGEIVQGAIFVAGFVVFIKYLVKVTKLGEKESIAKLSGLLISVSLAMVLMIGVCKLAAKLSLKEIVFGVAFVIGFVFFIKWLVKSTKLGDKESIAKLSGLLISVSLAMALMIGICKLAGRLSLKEIIRGVAFMFGFMLFVQCLVKATTITSGQQIAKVSATILAMSVAIAILAAVCVALSFLDLWSLTKGIAAVGLLSAMMALMVKSLKGAQNAKGAIMMMAITIGVMAAAIYVLSTLDTAKMLTSALGLTGAMAAFALMTKSLKGLKAKEALEGALSLLVLMVPVAAFAGILHHMGDINDLITKVVCLTGAMAAMTGLLFALKFIGAAGTEAIIGVGLLLAMMVPLVAFVGILHLLTGVEDVEKKIIALCAGMAALVVLLGILTIIGFGAVASLSGMAALLVFVGEIALIVTIINAIGGIASAALKAKLLCKAMEPLVDLLGVLTVIGFAAPAALGGIVSLLALVGSLTVIGAELAIVGAIVDKWPAIADKIESGTKILVKVADGLGTIVGTFISSLGKAVTEGMVDMAENFSNCMEKLAEASEKASKIDGESFEGVGDAMKALKDVSKTSLGTSVRDWAASLFDGDKRSSMEKFGDDGAAFFGSIKKISEAASEVKLNTYAMSSVMNFAKELVKLRSSLPQITTFGEWVTSDQNSRILENFGADCSKFIGSMVEAFGALQDDKGNNLNLNTWGMTNILKAAESLAGIQTQLRTAVEKIQTFDGYTAQLIQDTSLGTFGENCEIFVESMVAAFELLKDEEGNSINLNTTAMNTVVKIGNELAGIQTKLAEPITKITEFNKYSAELINNTSLTTFGVRCQYFVSSIVAAFDMLKTTNEDGTTTNVDLNTTAMDTVISVGNKLADIQIRLGESVGKIETFGDFIRELIANEDLSDFGENCQKFVGSIVEAFSSLNNEPTTIGKIFGQKATPKTLNTEGMDAVIAAAEKLNELQEKMPEAKSLIGWFKGTNKEDLGDFGENIGAFAEAMTKFSTGSGTFDSANFELIMGAADSLKTFTEGCADLNFDGLYDFIGDGSISSGYLQRIGKAMGQFGESVSDVNVEAVSTSVTAAIRLKNLINSLADLDNTGIDKFTPVRIGRSMQAYSESVAGFDSASVSSSITAAGRIKSLINSLKDLDNSGISNFTPLSIGTSIKNYSDKVLGINLAAIMNSINAATKIKNFISSLSGLKTNGVASFSAAVTGLSKVDFSGIADMMNGYADTMQSSGQTLMNGLGTGMQAGLEILLPTLDSIVKTMVARLQSKSNAFKTAGATFAKGIRSGFSSNSNTLPSAARTAASKMVSAVRSYWSSFFSAGEYLVRGFASGVKLYTYVAEEASRQMAKKAKEAAEKELGEQSPSKVFKQIGAYATEGFAIGLDSLGNRVEGSARNMADKAINTTRAAMTTVLDTLNSDIDSQPTIRPVVDLSDVRTGADAISGMFGGIQTVGVRSNLSAIDTAMNAKLQNGSNSDVVSAINKLGVGLENARGDTYNFGGFTYDDGSNVSDAVETLIRYARIGRRR